MPRKKITVYSSFNAEHAVILPEGQEPFHNHLWKVNATFGIKAEAMDAECQEIASEILTAETRRLEGCSLNEIPELRKYAASAESVARYMFDRLDKKSRNSEIRLQFVELEEEPGCRARFWSDEDIDVR
jgi:6-pyruvoyl-tetrahydropterin synthase